MTWSPTSATGAARATDLPTLKKMLARLALGALAFAWLTGCTITHVSIGSPIDEESMEEIIPGESMLSRMKK